MGPATLSPRSRRPKLRACSTLALSLVLAVGCGQGQRLIKTVQWLNDFHPWESLKRAIMIDPSWKPLEVTELGGQWDAGFIDIADFPPGVASVARNTEFRYGKAFTRTPFHGAIKNSSDGAKFGLFGWNTPNGNFVVIGVNGEFLMYSLDNKGNESTPLFSGLDELLISHGVNIAGTTWAPAGARLYMGAFLSSFAGATAGYAATYQPYFVAATSFTGVGLNDATIGGAYTGVYADIFDVEIDGTGSPNTFKWRRRSQVSYTTGVSITGASQALSHGVTVTFSATTGHTLGDVWQREVATHKADKLFPPPMTDVPGAPTEPSAGVITAGSHRLGYVVEYRHGAILRPSPNSSGAVAVQTFLPVTFTAAGGKNLSWVLNPTTWPADAVKVHVIMSPASNPSRYFFVPGANATVTGGAADSKTIVWSISDDDLVAQATEATDLLFLTTRTTTGTDPFKPSVILPYKDRMVYLTRLNDVQGREYVALIASDNGGHFQRWGLDYSSIVLPGQQDAVSIWELDGVLFVGGRNWTSWTEDNGLDPVGWPSLRSVDSTKGPMSPRAVAANKDARRCFVANDKGLYLFSRGGYSDRPISYFQTTTWERINKSAASTIEVVDDPLRYRVIVKAALDTDTTAKHLLVWDYTNGLTPEKAKFSLWQIKGSDANPYQIGGLAVINAPAVEAIETRIPKGTNLWLVRGNSAAMEDGEFLVQASMSYTDSTNNPRSDLTDQTNANAKAIDFLYKTGLFPGKNGAGGSALWIHHGCQLGIQGNGSLTPICYNRDESNSFSLAPITLAAAQPDEVTRLAHMIQEDVLYSFPQNVAGSNVVLSLIRHFLTPYATRR